MQETLDLIYSDSQINTYETMVPGSDLCDILGLFFDLAESMEVKHSRQKDALEKYKKAYNNKVKREKREKEKGAIEEDDPRFKTLREANTKLTQESEEYQKELENQKENLEVLLIDNDEKEAKIKELITDLNIKSATIENLMQGLTQATAESDQNTKKKHENKARDVCRMLVFLYINMCLKGGPVIQKRQMASHNMKIITQQKECLGKQRSEIQSPPKATFYTFQFLS